MKSNTLLVIGFVGLVFGLLIMGRGDGHVVSTQPATAVGHSAPQEAPDFTLDDLDGESLSLSDYRGDKPVILDFFATWCHNCRRAMPELDKIYEEYRDEVEVIGINLQEGHDTVARFISDEDISYPIVFDDTGVVSRTYGVRYTNTHVMIGTDGAILGVVPGDLSEEDVKKLIEVSG